MYRSNLQVHIGTSYTRAQNMYIPTAQNNNIRVYPLHITEPYLPINTNNNDHDRNTTHVCIITAHTLYK